MAKREFKKCKPDSGGSVRNAERRVDLINYTFRGGKWILVMPLWHEVGEKIHFMLQQQICNVECAIGIPFPSETAINNLI